MELQVGVKVLFRNGKGEFLFLKRSLEKYPEINEPWDIVGGRIEQGKTLFYNLRREISEELGFYYGESFRLVAAQDILKEDKHVVRLTYEANMVFADSDIILDPDHTEFKWMSHDDVLSREDVDKYAKEVVSLLAS